MDVDPVLPRITTPGRGDVGPDHMQTEEDSTIPSSVPVSSAQSSANIPSVKGDLHNYHHVFYIPTITMRILKYVDPEDLPKISQALPAVFDVLEKCFDWSNILVNMTYQDTEDYLQMAKLVTQIQQDSPTTHLTISPLLPRSDNLEFNDKIKEANKILKSFCSSRGFTLICIKM